MSMSRPSLVIATSNAGKFREFSQLLGALPLRLHSLARLQAAPVVSEDGSTYADNAAQKAVTIARWSGCATLADDSGLEVDALGGAPGLHSARYAGLAQDSEANIARLLQALRDVPAAARSARFRCVLVVAVPDGATLQAEGACEGRILEAPCGAGGFGYDPVFFHAASGLTFAEMEAAAKNRLSHRAAACAALSSELLGFLSAHAQACSRCVLG